jgi:hypothetical protein
LKCYEKIISFIIPVVPDATGQQTFGEKKMGYSKWDIEQLLSHSNRFAEQLSRCHAQNPMPCGPVNTGATGFIPSGRINDDRFFAVIEKELPPVFSRQVASEKIGRLVSVKTMANLDALNQGPSVKVKLGKKVGYERASFMEWLKGRLCSQAR